VITLLLAILCAAVAHAQATSPGLPSLPILKVVFEETPWWQSYTAILLSLVQFLILAVITILVFWSNATQKIREREATWYHDIVVDHAIERLKGLFGDLQQLLLQAAETVDGLRQSDVDEAHKQTIAAVRDAKRIIFQLRSEMGFRLSVFDPDLEQLFTRDLERLENEIVEWFGKQPDRRCYDASESLPAILSGGQVRLLRILMQVEFTNWGFTWPWSRRWTMPSLEKSPKSASK
jgi:hypothetical protein